MTNDQIVRCHICPMQELCEYAEPEDSYQRAQHLRDSKVTAEFDLEKLTKATENCPMRKKLREGFLGV